MPCLWPLGPRRSQGVEAGVGQPKGSFHSAPPPRQPSPSPRQTPAPKDKPKFQSVDIRVKQGLLQPNTSLVDLREHLEQQRQHSSQEGGSASSQAKSLGAHSKDGGGVWRQGGSQSSSHYRGSSQGRSGPSSHSGPPRPPPSATATSGALALASYAQVLAKVAKVPPDQGKRLVDHDRSRDHKVCYLLAEVHWGSYIYCCFSLRRFLVRKFNLNYSRYTKGRCSCDIQSSIQDSL